jgi:hypothetical protein
VVLTKLQCGVAIAGTDYSVTDVSVTFEPGEVEACTDVPITDDGILEGKETFELCVTNEEDVKTTVTILDDDDVTVDFVSHEVIYVYESMAMFNICIVRRGEASCPVTAYLSTCDASSTSVGGDTLDLASGGSDYEHSTIAVTFSPTELTKCFSHFSVLNDGVIERNEVFDFCLSSNTTSVLIAKENTVSVVIRNDDVNVTFEEEEYTVDISKTAVATVCLVKNGSVDFEIVVTATPVETKTELEEKRATAGEDFDDEPFKVTFGPHETTKCHNIVLKKKETKSDKVFDVVLETGIAEKVPKATVVTTDMTTVLLTTVFIATLSETVLSCIVENPLIITPFHITPRNTTPPTYNFMGPCEYELVRICEEHVNFRIHVDFLSQDLSTGRIGIVFGKDGASEKELSKIVISENLTIDFLNFNEPNVTTEAGGETVMRFNRSNITITGSSRNVSVQLSDFGIAVYLSQSPNEESLSVNVTIDTSLQNRSLCGLCGDIGGFLEYRGSNDTADILVPEEVQSFIQSWRVLPEIQFLRVPRGQCGIMKNDSVIGDPLFTVPLLTARETPQDLRSVSLCYEIHGVANAYFNLISDTCVSVNVLYSPMLNPSHGNIISKVGILAATNDENSCSQIQVDLDGCRTFYNGEELTTMLSRDAGIVIVRHRNKVRIAVPNCENKDLTMWVICQNISGQPMIKYQVNRGFNLRPTSHGLLGQFWNIPMSVVPYTLPSGIVATPAQQAAITSMRPYYVKVAYPESPFRQFTAFLHHREWDKTLAPCLYAGNRQGGPMAELPGRSDSVIDGHYRDYLTSGLYEDSFKYSKFEATCSRR